MNASLVAGVAIIFEAKVLSDVSTRVTFDVARNQIARIIDVMLEPGRGFGPLPTHAYPSTCLVLVTPELYRPGGLGAEGSRLYGWLMPDYIKPKGSLLPLHLEHRALPGQLQGVPQRLGWTTWEDIDFNRAWAALTLSRMSLIRVWATYTCLELAAEPCAAHRFTPAGTAGWIPRESALPVAPRRECLQVAFRRLGRHRIPVLGSRELVNEY